MPDTNKKKSESNSDIDVRVREGTARPALTIDYALYEKYLNDSDLTEAQKQEFLNMLWSIIVGFVDLGFGVHPLQQSGSAPCGQEIDLSGFVTDKMISSNDIFSSKEFENAAAGNPNSP